MLFFTTLVIAVLLPFSFAFSLPSFFQIAERDACPSVHVFMARGNGEPYPGRVGDVAAPICSGLPSCDTENILFDSSQVYCNQVYDGVKSGIAQITAYASKCPDTQIVLAGYSLGAHIVGDILGGGGGPFYTCTETAITGLNPFTGPGTKISVALLFGDVRHTADQSYNVGTGSGSDGQYPRSGSILANMNSFAGRMQSYCISTDPICALGNDGLSHTTYMERFAVTAGAWAQSILKAGVPAPVSSAVPKSTSTTSSSTKSKPSTTFSPPVLSVSSTASSQSGSVVSSATSSSSAPSSTSSSTTSSASSTTSSKTVTSTFAPFVFSDPATNKPTSTYKPTTNKSASSLKPTTITTSTASKTTSSTTKSTTSITTTSVSSTTFRAENAVASSTSKGGAYVNGVQLSLNIVTLVVIKVLVF